MSSNTNNEQRLSRANSTESITDLLLSNAILPRPQRSSSMPHTLIEALVKATSDTVMHRSRSMVCFATFQEEAKVKKSRSSEDLMKSVPRKSSKRTKMWSRSPVESTTAKKRRHRSIPRTSAHRSLYHGPIPKWIDITYQSPSPRRRKRDPDLLPLSDVAMKLSNHLENAIQKGLYASDRHQGIRTEEEVIGTIERVKRSATKAKLETASEGRAQQHPRIGIIF